MKTCGACGLPAPDAAERCGFCHTMLPLAVPDSLRMVLDGVDATVTSPAGLVCRVRRRGLRWNVTDPLDDVLFRLCPYSITDGSRLAIVGDHAALAGSVQLTDGGSTAAVLADGDGDVVATAFTDGPTGLHVVGASGDVCGLLSVDDRAGGRALDAVLTGAGQRMPSPLGLGLVIALGLSPALTGRR